LAEAKIRLLALVLRCCIWAAGLEMI